MLGVVDAVAQDADEPPDELLGALGVRRDEITDVVQCVIDKVGVDLGLQVLHLHPAVHLDEVHVPLAQLLNAAHHLVDLMGDLFDLVAGVDLNDMVGVFLPDEPDLLHEGVHRLHHLLGHDVHDADEHRRPAQAQHQNQEQPHQKIIVVRGRVDEGISQHRAVFQRAAAAQIAAPIHLHIPRRVGGAVFVGVLLGEEGGVRAGDDIAVGLGEDGVVLVSAEQLRPVVLVQIDRRRTLIFAVPVEGVYHDVFRAVGPEVVDRGIDGPHEVAGVFLRDAVELLPVQVHLPL